ncbi:MAG: TIGR00289 family protein [Candidatus Jordarchaeales archaeon]
MRVAVLFSGGKDSSLALLWALNDNFEIEALVSFIPERDDSYMFHVPNIKVIKLHAEAAGLPYVPVPSSGLKDREISELEEVLGRINVDAVVSGVVSSEYQKTAVEKVCKRLELKYFTPLWHINETLLLLNVVNLGFDARFCGVYALGFTRNWLGRKLDHAAIADLLLLKKTYGVSMAGEGGEYETLVLDAPYYKKRVEIVDAETYWDDFRGQLLVKKARLAEKGRGEK